jgi:hypothetical protein
VVSITLWAAVPVVVSVSEELSGSIAPHDASPKTAEQASTAASSFDLIFLYPLFRIYTILF